MSAGWETLGTQNNSLTIDLSEEEDPERPLYYWTDTIVRLKQVIY